MRGNMKQNDSRTLAIPGTFPEYRYTYVGSYGLEEFRLSIRAILGRSTGTNFGNNSMAFYAGTRTSYN
jgi:hypothetical protein